MISLIYKEECYRIVGSCFEVHSYLGPGFLEVVYKDALEIEFKRAGIPFEREKIYTINYKGEQLQHYFIADFVLFNSIILEVKGTQHIMPEHIAQALNYLKVSKNVLALIANFGEQKFVSKRIVC
jgi:GxxExxY protein